MRSSGREVRKEEQRKANARELNERNFASFNSPALSSSTSCRTLGEPMEIKNK